MLNIYVLENPVQRGATAGAIGLARDLLSEYKGNLTCVKTLDEVKPKADMLFSISYDHTKTVQDFHKKHPETKIISIKDPFTMAAQSEGSVKASDYDMYQAIIDVMGTIPDAMMAQLGSKAMKVKMPPTDLKKEHIEAQVTDIQTKANSGDLSAIKTWEGIKRFKKDKIAFLSVGGPDPYTGIKTSLEDVTAMIEKLKMLSELGAVPYVATMGRTEQHISDALETQLKSSGHHSYFEYFTEGKERKLIEIKPDGSFKDMTSDKLHYHMMLWLCDFRIATDDSLSTMAEGGMFGKPAAMYMLKDSENVLPRKKVREYLRDKHNLSIITKDTKLDELKRALVQNVSPPCEPNIEIIQHIKKALAL